jgi:hypothetical protein
VRRYEHLKAARLAPVLGRFLPEELGQLSELLERFSLSLLARELEGRRDGSCLRCDAYLQSGCPIGRLRGGCPYEGVTAGRRAEAGAS